MGRIPEERERLAREIHEGILQYYEQKRKDYSHLAEEYGLNLPWSIMNA